MVQTFKPNYESTCYISPFSPASHLAGGGRWNLPETRCPALSPTSSLSPSPEGSCMHEKQGHVSETLATSRETQSRAGVENIQAGRWPTVTLQGNCL